MTLSLSSLCVDLKAFTFFLLIFIALESCPFCDRETFLRQGFYEDEEVMAILSHKPVLPYHSLIIPKRHVERFEELTEGEVLAVYRAVQKVHELVSSHLGTRAYLLHQKNGIEVGQSVPHLHFHYIARPTGESSSFTFAFQIIKALCLPPLTQEELALQISSFSRGYC